MRLVHGSKFKDWRLYSFQVMIFQGAFKPIVTTKLVSKKEKYMVPFSNASLLLNLTVSFSFCLSFCMQDGQSCYTGGLIYIESVSLRLG